MQIGITGASGVVGANIALHLLSVGHRVRCTRRAPASVAPLEGKGLEFVAADVLDVESLARAFVGCDAVIHCAALVSMWRGNDARMLDENVRGVRNVIDAMKRTEVKRLLHCSTIDTFGLAPPGGIADESTPWNFPERGIRNGYAVAKRAADDVVRAAVAAGLDAVLFHPAFVVGAYSSLTSSGRLLIELAQKKVPMAPRKLKNFVAAGDLAAGVEVLLERGVRGESYILGGENLPIADFLAQAAAVLGVRAPPLPFLRRPAMLAATVLDTVFTPLGREPPLTPAMVQMSSIDQPVSSKKAEALGYRHGPVRVGIEEAVAFYRARGLLPTR